ncbi:MAG: PAS domain-containing protein [Hyphomicrobiales bacterium]|nr:PAS domain-containing protein [Hyphomicrobiales bacterium]MDE2116097.1 PAS domain-containing protein [Hyphomicrobiales bacterium]
MRQPATRELFRRWNQLRGERSAPERNGLDPVLLQGVISETFMLEADPQGRFPIVLAGARCEALFNGSLRGRSFIDLWPAHERRQISALCACVMDGCVPIVAGMTAAPLDRAPIALEMLLLPLRHNGRTHSRILGCWQSEYHPEWLGLLPVENLHFKSLRILSTPDADPAAHNAGLMNRRDSESGRFPIPHAPHRGAQLVLHEGGRGK